MGNRKTRKRKRRRKTVRGGDTKEAAIRRILAEITSQVFQPDPNDEEVNGFYGRLYGLLESDDLIHVDEDTNNLLQDIARQLREFENILAVDRALSVQEFEAWMEDILFRLNEMLDEARQVSARVGNEEMIQEIQAEINYMRQKRDELN